MSLAELNIKIHLAVDAHGMPVRFFITDVTVADCSVAEALISNFSAEYLLADRGYDTDAIIRRALQAGMTQVVLRNYDKHIYKLRHLVENAFLPLKRWRGIATRSAKNVASFVAAVQIKCIALLALLKTDTLCKMRVWIKNLNARNAGAKNE